MMPPDHPDGDGTTANRDVPLVPPPAVGPGGPNRELGGYGGPPPPGAYDATGAPLPPPPGAYDATGAPPQPGQYGPYGPYNVPPAIPYGQVSGVQTNGLAVTALVLGILGVIMPCIPVMGVGALAVGSAAYKKSSSLGGSGRGMAIAGLVLGAISTAMFILWVIWLSFGNALTGY